MWCLPLALPSTLLKTCLHLPIHPHGPFPPDVLPLLASMAPLSPRLACSHPQGSFMFPSARMLSLPLHHPKPSPLVSILCPLCSLGWPPWGAARVPLNPRISSMMLRLCRDLGRGVSSEERGCLVISHLLPPPAASAP